ncbi:Splicing regulatory glutamine/lysine-rich protein 1, partial [Ophiophagus hannah]
MTGRLPLATLWQREGDSPARWVGVVRQVVGVARVGPSGSVGRAVDPQRRVELRSGSGQQPILVRRATEGRRRLGRARGNVGGSSGTRDENLHEKERKEKEEKEKERGGGKEGKIDKKEGREGGREGGRKEREKTREK